MDFGGCNTQRNGTINEVIKRQTPENAAADIFVTHSCHSGMAKIESLLVALGAKVSEGNGSRVRFEINQVVASFHRPHPDKEAKVYQVRDAMAFLIAVGVTP